MAFYGSNFVNGQQLRHARHIACPQHLKYIPNIKDGYVACVQDSADVHPSLYRNGSQKSNRLSLYNTADAWRRELMGLAQQVQSSLVPLNEPRLTQRRSKTRSSSSLSNYHSEDNNEQNISKRLLNRRYQRLYSTKPKIPIDKTEQESSTNNENQDPGIWLLPMLCHTLQVDNIFEAQDWLVNANPTEKRLAMELISRTMQDMQNRDNDFISDCDQYSTSSNINNLYWPYKFWQHQQQSKLSIDNNDTCERATSPVRILTPAKRLSTSSHSSKRPQTSSIDRLVLTPMTPNTPHRQSRRSYRVTTSRSTSTDAANLRSKTPLI